MAPRRLAVAIVPVMVALLAMLGLRTAHAEDKPWAAGVSKADQAAALALYQEGNGFFEQSQFAPALEKYRLALAAWDHPAIRYNAAVCLINLDRPVEADAHLTAAMRYGAAPLGADLYKQGQSYAKLLAPRIAELEVVCKEPGAEVILDGEKLFDAPGARTVRVLAADPHQIVAQKERYETVTQSITLPAGEKRTLVLEMKLLESAKRVTRRWRTWKPWSVIVGGAAVGLAGLGMYALARGGFDEFDAGIDAECGMRPDGSSGCTMTPAHLASLEDRANRNQVIAFSGFAVGGALIATGAFLVYLNQPRLATSTTIVPTVGPDHAGAVLSGRW